MKLSVAQLAPKLARIRPTNVELAVRLSVEAVITLAWLGALVRVGRPARA